MLPARHDDDDSSKLRYNRKIDRQICTGQKRDRETDRKSWDFVLIVPDSVR